MQCVTSDTTNEEIHYEWWCTKCSSYGAGNETMCCACGAFTKCYTVTITSNYDAPVMTEDKSMAHDPFPVPEKRITRPVQHMGKPREMKYQRIFQYK